MTLPQAIEKEVEEFKEKAKSIEYILTPEGHKISFSSLRIPMKLLEGYIEASLRRTALLVLEMVKEGIGEEENVDNNSYMKFARLIDDAGRMKVYYEGRNILRHELLSKVEALKKELGV